jgi:tetratricopeptide (TPR) repeat protein
VSYGKATPYFPVIELLKHYAHIEDSDDVRARRARVTGQVLTLDETLQDTLPALLALLDVLPADSPFLKLDPPQRRQRTLESLKRLLLRESQAQPLLLVFEDLHWIDAETQALLDLLVDSLPTARLLFLVNYRPEYQHGWGSKTYYTQLRLDPLPAASADEFLQALLGNDVGSTGQSPLQALKQLLIERTGGNPFFLEESVRTLVETGVLAGEPGAYRLTQSLTILQVPATVQAVLAARIDRLSAEAKRLLQTAAVIGHEVPLPLLQAIADIPEAALYRSLVQLQGAEFLYETRLFPEREYTFKHALTHEVAYGSLLQERRRVLHASIVAALEGLYPDRLAEQVERLAHHALRGEVWDKALTYFRQAGEKAMAQSAYREAVEYWEQALRALTYLPESSDLRAQAIDLRLDLRNPYQMLGEYERMLDHLHAAEALAEALGDHHRLTRISAYMSNYLWSRGDLERALTAAQRDRGTAREDVVLQVLANQYLGTTYSTLGDYGRAIAVFRQNVVSLAGDLRQERCGLAGVASVIVRSWLVMCLAETGAFAEGILIGDEGVSVAEAVDHPYSRSAIYYGVGLLYLRQGDLPRAIPRLEGSLTLCHMADIHLLFPFVASALGAAYALSGRDTDALRWLEQAVAQSIAMQFMAFQALRVAEWGQAVLWAGRLEEAHTLAERALALAREHQERGHQAYALRLLGDIAARREPPENTQAEAYYHQALTLAEELGMRPLQAHCHLGLGTLHARIGRPEQARPALSAAIVLYRAMEMAFWLPQVESALAQVGSC